MSPLPIGIQDFAEVITNGYLYVDKTRNIFDLVQPRKGYYFLSRPRRFGKSLLISTLEEIFSGNRGLFKGLWIEEQSQYAWPKHPVIRIDFSKLSSSDPKLLEKDLRGRMQAIARDYQVNLNSEDTIVANTGNLIEELHRKTGERVVILIDEYDSPISTTLMSPRRTVNYWRSFTAQLRRAMSTCDLCF